MKPSFAEELSRFTQPTPEPHHDVNVQKSPASIETGEDKTERLYQTLVSDLYRNPSVKRENTQ